MRFNVGVASVEGEYEVCYCSNYDILLGGGVACNQDSEFTHLAGSMEVRGPTGSEDVLLKAGVAQTLGPFTGCGINPAVSTTRFQPAPLAESCSSACSACSRACV